MRHLYGESRNLKPLLYPEMTILTNGCDDNNVTITPIKTTSTLRSVYSRKSLGSEAGSVNTMAAEALAPYVAKASAVILLTM